MSEQHQELRLSEENQGLGVMQQQVRELANEGLSHGDLLSEKGAQAFAQSLAEDQRPSGGSIQPESGEPSKSESLERENLDQEVNFKARRRAVLLALPEATENLSGRKLTARRLAMLLQMIEEANLDPKIEFETTATGLLKSLRMSGEDEGLISSKAIGDDLGLHWLRLPTRSRAGQKVYSLKPFVGLVPDDVHKFFDPGWSWKKMKELRPTIDISQILERKAIEMPKRSFP